MPRIQSIHLAAAQRRVEPLSVEKAKQLSDEIFARQPNLLASILVLPQHGVAFPELDVALKILFILYCALDETGIAIPTITEDDQDRCLRRIIGRAQFLEGLELNHLPEP